MTHKEFCEAIIKNKIFTLNELLYAEKIFYNQNTYIVTSNIDIDFGKPKISILLRDFRANKYESFYFLVTKENPDPLKSFTKYYRIKHIADNFKQIKNEN